MQELPLKTEHKIQLKKKNQEKSVRTGGKKIHRRGSVHSTLCQQFSPLPSKAQLHWPLHKKKNKENCALSFFLHHSFQRSHANGYHSSFACCTHGNKGGGEKGREASFQSFSLYKTVLYTHACSQSPKRLRGWCVHVAHVRNASGDNGCRKWLLVLGNAQSLLLLVVVMAMVPILK